MKKLLDWLFNRINVGDKFSYDPEFMQGTILVATVKVIKRKTIVYTVSINGTEDSNARIKTIKHFKEIYKKRL